MSKTTYVVLEGTFEELTDLYVEKSSILIEKIKSVTNISNLSHGDIIEIENISSGRDDGILIYHKLHGLMFFDFDLKINDYAILPKCFKYPEFKITYWLESLYNNNFVHLDKDFMLKQNYVKKKYQDYDCFIYPDFCIITSKELNFDDYFQICPDDLDILGFNNEQILFSSELEVTDFSLN